MDSMELALTNLMRGYVARQEALRQMQQIDHDSKQQTLVSLAFAMYLAFIVDTPVAHFGAIIAVVSATAILINGTFLLHREYVDMEQVGRQGEWSNPSLYPSSRNRFGVGVTATVAFSAPVIAVLIHVLR